MPSKIATIVLLAVSLFVTSTVAKERLQPFVLASESNSELSSVVAETISKLTGTGFDMVADYSPFKDSVVIIVTSQELQNIAAKTSQGGYGAVQRVGVSQVGDRVEVTYINPIYLQHAYRLKGDLSPVKEKLQEALGHTREFGVVKTKTTAKKLKKYHYMFSMPYFDDPYELAEFKSHAAAIAATEKAINKEGDAISLVYRLDIAGAEQTVFGVSMNATNKKEQDLDDEHQLSIVDFESPKKSAYLPYEVLVTGNRVEALHMKFRMALHFPDLSMMGDNSFMKLRPSPGKIKDALEEMFED